MTPPLRVAGPIVFFALLHVLLALGGFVNFLGTVVVEAPDPNGLVIFGGGAAQLVLAALAMTLRATPLHQEHIGRLVIAATFLLMAATVALVAVSSFWSVLLPAPMVVWSVSLALGGLAQQRGWRWTNEPILAERPCRFSLADALRMLIALAACLALQRAINSRNDLPLLSLFFGGLCLAVVGAAVAALTAGPRATLVGLVAACLVGFCFGALADGVHVDRAGRVQFRHIYWRWGAMSTAVLLAAEMIALRQAGWRIDRPSQPNSSTNPPTTPPLGE